MYFFNYPAETPEAVKFWGSRHAANTAKAYVAFSLDKVNFIEITKRAGFSRAWRDRMWEAFGQYVNQPDMVGIPFSEMSDPWWEEMPTPTLFQFDFPVVTPVPMEPDPEIPIYPVISKPLQNITTKEGKLVLLETDGTDFESIQWYRGNTPISGETSKNYSFIASMSDNNISYIAEYKNNDKVSTTRSVISVTSGAPVVTLDPIGGQGTEGEIFQFVANAEDFESIQWYKMNRSTLKWEAVQGGNSVTLDVLGTHTGFPETYKAIFTNQFGYTSTEVAEVFFAEDAVPFALTLVADKTSSNTQIGYWSGIGLGDITPNLWGSTPGDTWTRLSITMSNGTMFIGGVDSSGTDIKFDNLSEIFLEFEGFSGNPVRAGWSTSRYTGPATDLMDYLDDLVTSAGGPVSIGFNVYDSAQMGA
ncbi:hypothetical protein [Vibrio phage vB_VpaP_SJSY21]|nr:hypothetical protein [Vibrio phage vB_VpaP_SJSY21]